MVSSKDHLPFHGLKVGDKVRIVPPPENYNRNDGLINGMGAGFSFVSGWNGSMEEITRRTVKPFETVVKELQSNRDGTPKAVVVKRSNWYWPSCCLQKINSLDDLTSRLQDLTSRIELIEGDLNA